VDHRIGGCRSEAPFLKPSTIRRVREWCRCHAVKLAIALAVLAVLLGVVVTVQAVMLRAQGWRIVPGTVPDWFSAAGAVATVGALVVAWRVYRHDVDSRREDRGHRYLAERRQQAENITAWPGSQTAVEREVIAGQGPVVTSTVQVNILNASPSVIYDVIVVTTNRHSGHPGLINSPIGVSVAPNLANVRFEEFDWLPNRDRLARGRAQVVPPGRWRVSVKLAHPCVVAEEVHLFFRDHRGVYWWRDADGQLTELPAPPNRDRDGRKQQIEDALGEGPSDSGLGILIPKPLSDAEVT
jgi:hypothetical protein